MYTQIAQIPEGTARRDALWLTKKKAKSLPRVTAYSTAACVRPFQRLPDYLVIIQVLPLVGPYEILPSS